MPNAGCDQPSRSLNGGSDAVCCFSSGNGVHLPDNDEKGRLYLLWQWNDGQHLICSDQYLGLYFADILRQQKAILLGDLELSEDQVGELIWL